MKTLIIFIALVFALACAPPRPKIICVMQNPATGARVELYKEVPYKVPANYNERRHIEEWKAEQVKKGYSVEVTK